MSKPEDMGIVGQELYDRTEPAHFAEAEHDYPWAKYLAALGEVLEPVAVVTRPDSGEEQWIVLASPKRCPDAWLPVLAQWAGVRRPDTMSKDDLRALIGPRAPGMWRGTRAAMIAAVTRFMPEGTPPEQMLYFEERADGDPYKLRVFTYEFVEHDSEAVQNALLHEKPAGLTLEYDVRVGQTWAMLRDCGPTWWQVNQFYANWYEVLHQPPPPPCPDYPEMPEPPPPLPVQIDSVTPASMATNDFVELTMTGSFPALEGNYAAIRPADPDYLAFSVDVVVVVDASTATVQFSGWGGRLEPVGLAKLYIVDTDFATSISNEIDFTLTPPA